MSVADAIVDSFKAFLLDNDTLENKCAVSPSNEGTDYTIQSKYFNAFQLFITLTKII